MSLSLPSAADRVPASDADLSSIHPDHQARALEIYTFPDGTVSQEALEDFARVYPARSGPDLSVLSELAARRSSAKEALADAEAEFREELRATYRDGVPASALAGATGLSLVRVQQLVAGARR